MTNPDSLTDVIKAVARGQYVSGAVYKGPLFHLKGKTALVKVFPDRVDAQFDDLTLAESIGWRPFSRDDFEGLETGDVEGEPDAQQ